MLACPASTCELRWIVQFSCIYKPLSGSIITSAHGHNQKVSAISLNWSKKSKRVDAVIVCTRKLSYRKDDRAMRLYIGALKISKVPEYAQSPTATFPEIFNGLLFRSILWMCVQNFVHSFTRSWDNRGTQRNLGSAWIRPRSLFSKILRGFCSDAPYECTGQIWSPWL